MDSETTDVGFELLKYILLLGSIPIWGPFAKALWDEFLRALRADGGLNGPEPTSRERKNIEARIATEEESSQVHEPIANRRGGAGGWSTPPRPGSTPRSAPAADPRRSFQRAGDQPKAAPGRPRFR